MDTTIKVKHSHIFEIDDSFSDRFADWSKDGSGDPLVCNFRDETEGKPEIPTTAPV